MMLHMCKIDIVILTLETAGTVGVSAVAYPCRLDFLARTKSWMLPGPTVLLLLRRVPRALEGGPSERQHLLGVGCEDSEWGRRTTKGVLPKEIEIRASLQLMF